MDVFFSAGGRYRTADIERVLRFRCGSVHLDERRGGSGRDRDDRLASSSTPAPKSYFRQMHPRGDRRYHSSTRHGQRWKKVYFNDEQDDWNGDAEEEAPPTEEEDLEQEVFEGRHADAYYGDDDYYGGYEEDDGWWHDSYWQDQTWEEADDDFQQASMSDLSEAYAAGWTAKALSAGIRKGRGYTKGGSKGGGKKRPLDRRTVEDRKKYSACSSCGQMGHWRGDPQCPKVQRGEDPPREKNEVHEANLAATKTPTSPPSTSPEPARAKARGEEPRPAAPKVGSNKARASKEEIIDEEPRIHTHKINWTMMVNDTLGRRLRGYRSDDDPSEASVASDHESEDFTMLSSTAGESQGPARPRRSEFRLALSTSLKALDYEESDAEDQLRRRLRKEKKDQKDVKVSAQEMMAALPHMSKEEKRRDRGFPHGEAGPGRVPPSDGGWRRILGWPRQHSCTGEHRPAGRAGSTFVGGSPPCP